MVDSHIPKKPKKVGWTEKHCMLWKKHGDLHKSHNTHLTAIILARMAFQPIRRGAHVSPNSIWPVTQKVTTMLTMAREVAGWIALGDYIIVRNIN